jgi:4-alpha-glucanotransferase
MPGARPIAREAGLLVPLFSCHSRSGWGIGEFADVPLLAAWMRGAGLRVLQLLPLNEMAPGQTSPYSAISSMALDPLFIRVPDVPDYLAVGGEASLDTAARGMLSHVRAKPGVDYWAVRTLKDRVLRQAFRHFLEQEWVRDTARATALKAFMAGQAWWLDDYAVYRAALHASDGQEWQAWPDGLGSHAEGAVARARREHHQEVLYRTYLQWIAHDQWQAARQAASGVSLFGDFPFMVAANSADAWAHQRLFSFDSTVGAPPDAFSRDGQNWGLPVYRWDVLREHSYDWFFGRARRMADLFDGFRVDHVVGLFRTWVFPRDGAEPHFTPPDEPTQNAQGRAVLQVIQQAGAFVIAEDLGTIPDVVRQTLQSLEIPGYKVLRWERRWHEPGQPFDDPGQFPEVSLATSGTHDTETLAQWWAECGAVERARVLALPSAAGIVLGRQLTADTPFVPGIRDLLVELLIGAGSSLVIVPIQDLFGWSDRVNVPAVVDDKNWTWKLPWPLDDLADNPQARERQDTLARLVRAHGR